MINAVVWTTGDLITQTKMSGMAEDQINSADNIHPQYDTTLGWRRKVASITVSDEENIYFYHLKTDGAVHTDNKYRLFYEVPTASSDYNVLIELRNATSGAFIKDILADTNHTATISPTTVDWTMTDIDGFYFVRFKITNNTGAQTFNWLMCGAAVDPN